MKAIAINKAPKGEYIKRKADSVKVYRLGSFDRALKRWEVIDCDDISRCLYLKSSTIVFIGFTY